MSRMKIKIDIYLLTVLAVPVFFLAEAFALGQPQEKDEADLITLKPGASYTAGNLRDPFTNPVQADVWLQAGEFDPNAPEVPLPAMKVQGIFWGGDFPLAIINDRIVKVGEKIEGAQIISIEKDLVKVFFSNKQFVIYSPASDNLAASFNKKDNKKGGN
jgi:hypothetical protein